MHVRQIQILLLLLLCSPSLYAQAPSGLTGQESETKKEAKPPARNNILYIEGGGICAYYSANYQHNFRISNRIDLAAGIALAPVVLTQQSPSGSNFSPRLAFQGQGIYKMGRHAIGLGAAYCFYTYHYPQVPAGESSYQEIHGAVGAQLGYSYSTKKNIYLGAYLTPYIMDSGDFKFTPWGGVRLGYRFR